ncbi:hypothetical protein K458DRAFT_101758 [Lentithecium fluviatile CBS 122367]|uniref:Uncharacterized protein n=1 Tax=Lentithecium fluviatile CBS 122367 TaxID=1168545 RepID=A0A6G1JJG8_9PLEO|nr:hypothetical protein K458DRAFT_101758 [Lentithecium fluviatile CBS 122367]
MVSACERLAARLEGTFGNINHLNLFLPCAADAPMFSFLSLEDHSDICGRSVYNGRLLGEAPFSLIGQLVGASTGCFRFSFRALIRGLQTSEPIFGFTWFHICRRGDHRSRLLFLEPSDGGSACSSGCACSGSLPSTKPSKIVPPRYPTSSPHILRMLA